MKLDFALCSQQQKLTEYMQFIIEGQLLDTILDTLQAATAELARVREQLKVLQGNDLLTEAEAQTYLKRDADTLLYYRRLGLSYYKKGKNVWYKKSDIDTWLESGKVNRHKR